MHTEEVLELLRKTGAIVSNSHFVGTSGLHFDTYINKDFLYPHTKDISRVCELMAEQNKDKDIEVVVGPALGGIVLSQWVAYHLSRILKKEVLGLYTEKTADGGQVFTRGYGDFVKGKKILIVEDNTVTGGSVLKVINAVKHAGGNIAGVSVMINKDPELVNEESLKLPFSALIEYAVPTYKAEACPLCKTNVPINTILGHGKKFLEAQKK